MYKRYYKEYGDEVHRVLSCFIFWRMLNHRVADDQKLLMALNRTALSWIVIRHSLFVSLFITLGRIFDIDDKSFSVELIAYFLDSFPVASTEIGNSLKVGG